MAIKPPVRQQGYVTRGVLQDALKTIRREVEDGAVAVPQGNIPKGTGFRHITNDLEDPQAKTVSTTDIDDHAVTFAKQQNIDTARLLGRATAGPGPIEELTAEEARAVLELDAEPHIADPAGGAVIDVEARAAIGSILDLLEDLLLMEP